MITYNSIKVNLKFKKMKKVLTRGLVWYILCLEKQK